MQIVIKTLKGKQHPIDYEAETTVSFFFAFYTNNLQFIQLNNFRMMFLGFLHF